MIQVDVLYEQTGPRRVEYYPQTPAAQEFFSGPFLIEDGAYPFAEASPDLKWLEAAGLTHASKEPS